MDAFAFRSGIGVLSASALDECLAGTGVNP